MSKLIISRVRTALYKQGYQGFTKEQILEAASVLNINVNDPSVEDTKAVASYLIQNQPSGITVTPQSQPLDILDEMTESDRQSPSPSTEPESEPSAITQSNRFDMVSSQVDFLGLSICDSDIELIATKINFEAGNYKELINEIRRYLLAFVKHKADNVDAQILSVFSDTISYANQRNKDSGELFSSLSKQFGQQMEESGISLKSSIGNSLKKYLSIPPIS